MPSNPKYRLYKAAITTLLAIRKLPAIPRSTMSQPPTSPVLESSSRCLRMFM